LACPNPNPVLLSVKLESAVDDLELKIYSPALAMEARTLSGPYPSGWISLPLDPSFIQSAPNGLYYYRLMGRLGGVNGDAWVGKLVMLR
jgi:hypothetical protein